MIGLLSKILIKNREEIKNREVRKAYGMLMSTVGIAANVLLALTKFVAGTLSGSLSVTADALNNFSDAGSQIISLISFKISSKPADRSHPFGHARMEYIASLLVSVLILLVGAELGKESVIKIFRPTEPEFGFASLAVLALSVLVKLWLGLEGMHLAKKIDSTVIRATASDSISDVFATSAVLLSALLCRFTGINADAFMGLIVAVMILKTGFTVIRETIDSILGGPPSPEILEGILAAAKEYPDILEVHDVVLHHYGAGRTLASLHAEVDGSQDIFYLHDVIDRMEKQLQRELGVEATVHMDPTVTNDARFSLLRGLVAEAVKSVDGNISVHDCRLDPGGDRHKFIFDISVPYELQRTDEELCDAVRAKLIEIDHELRCDITVDRQ